MNENFRRTKYSQRRYIPSIYIVARRFYERVGAYSRIIVDKSRVWWNVRGVQRGEERRKVPLSSRKVCWDGFPRIALGINHLDEREEDVQLASAAGSVELGNRIEPWSRDVREPVLPSFPRR